MKAFPPQLKAEVKFSTGTIVTVPERECEALHPGVESAAGVIAVLCLAGNRELDGEWLLLDPARAFPGRKLGAMAMQVEDFARMAEKQKHLYLLRQALSTAWRPYLHTYLAQATASRAALQAELTGRHRAGTLGEFICADAILDCDHLGHLHQIVHVHGEGVAGGVFQELFAYLLGCVGYKNVVSNPIGVPDIIASGLVGGDTVADFGDLTPGEIERVSELCEMAGEFELARRLRRAQ